MSEPAVGRKFSIDTIIPPAPECTSYVDAGAIAIGIEYREVNEDIVMANLNAHGMDRPPPGAVQVISPDGGVSLHVCDAAGQSEYLRFDAFGISPHYHYLCQGEYQINVPYDSVACGDMIGWALGCIRERLPQMLEFCGATELAAQVNPAAIAAALPRVIDLIRRTSV